MLDEMEPAPDVVKEDFRKVQRFQCTFCFGKNCSKEQWQKCPNPIIHGLHSNLVEGKFIASQRPSARKIEKYNVIKQMLE